VENQDMQNVQATASTGAVAPEGANPPVQPSPEDAKIQELVAKAVAVEIAKQSEAAKREIQSVKDRARAEVEAAQRRARLAETTSTTVMQQLKEADPDSMTRLELARLKAEEAERQRLEHEDAAKRAQAEFHQQFHSGLVDVVTEMGYDPTDKRIDWAEDAPNYLEAQKRVLKSVAKMKRETDKSIDLKIKEEVSKTRKELGLDSVDTTTGSVTTDGIPTSLPKFRAWVDNLPSAEYAKLKPKIQQMLDEGKIK